MTEEERNRAGLLSDERVRGRLRQALGVAEPDQGLRSRVVASMPIDVAPNGPRWQWAAGGVAFLLAAAMVATLIVVRHGVTTQPASQGRLVGSLNMTAQVGFRCTLPVIGYATQARISFPDGGVTVDKTRDPQQGKGSYGLAYAGGKWLPVQPSWVAPGGRSYAYATVTSGVPGKQATSALFVHDVASGRDRQLWSGDSGGQVLGWGPAGIYFMRQLVDPTGPTSPELWVVDPANPAGVHRVGPNPPPARSSGSGQPTTYGFQIIAGGAAWGITFPPQTGAAPGSPGNIPPARIDRMDLRDGSVSTWYTAPDGLRMGLAGVDAQGHPVLLLNAVVKGQAGPPPSPGPNSTPYVSPPPQVVLLTGPNQTRTIASGSDPTFRPNLTAVDSHGIWFSSPGSLWLYRNGSLTKVADVPGELFPTPTAPPGVDGKGSAAAAAPPAYPTGVTLNISGACA